MFSRVHIEQHVIPALRKEKHNHKIWRASTKKSACPMIYHGKEDKPLYFCFGCKKAASFLPSHHLQECKEAQLHIDTLKKLLGDPTEEEEEVAVDVTALKKELEYLKKKMKELQLTERAAEEQREERDTFIEKYFGKSFDDMDEEEREALIEKRLS